MILALLIYMVLGTLIAVYSKKSAKTHESYFLADRRVGGVVSALTYASTTYSAFMMVGLVGLAYKTGVGSAGFELLYLVGTLFLLSYYAPKFWSLGRTKGYVSPCELFEERYGKVVSALASILALIALIPYTSIQFIGSAYIVGDYKLSLVIIALTVALWSLSGMKSVAITDAIQGVFMLAMAVLALIWVAFNISYGIPKCAEFPNSFWTPSKFFALSLPWFFFALTNPQVSQRMFIPKDEKAIRKMVLLFGLFGLVYTVLVTALGLFLRQGSSVGIFPQVSNMDKVTAVLLSKMPAYLSVLVALSILMASITTADSIILTLSSMVLRDVLGEKSKIVAGKAIVVVLTIVVTAFAYQKPGYIVGLAVLSSTILLCQLPLIFGYFHWRKGGKIAGSLTLLVGFFSAVVLSALKYSFASVMTFLLSFATFFIVGSIEGRRLESIKK